MQVLEGVQGVVQGICEGRFVQTIDHWYDENVLVVESGAPPREGRAVHRAHAKAFVQGVEFHGAEPSSVLIDGDRAVVEWMFDITPRGGERRRERRLSLQTWRDGRIVREDVYH